jgi:hypothetical protein
MEDVFFTNFACWAHITGKIFSPDPDLHPELTSPRSKVRGGGGSPTWLEIVSTQASVSDTGLKALLLVLRALRCGHWAENFSPLNRTKEFITVDSPSPRQVQESRDSTIDFDQPLVLSRLSSACVGEGDSTVLNSFVQLRGLKFSALVSTSSSSLTI